MKKEKQESVTGWSVVAFAVIISILTYVAMLPYVEQETYQIDLKCGNAHIKMEVVSKDMTLDCSGTI